MELLEQYLTYKIRRKYLWKLLKLYGIGLIALIIIILLKQYKPEFAIYASLIAGALILTLVFSKISNVISLINNLTSKISVNREFITLILKMTGIAILTEFAVSICKDSNEAAIASKIDLGGKVIMVSMSVPIIAGLLETILKLL